MNELATVINGLELLKRQCGYGNSTNRIILDEGHKLGIWHHTVERAIYLRRNSPLDFEILNFALKTTRLHETGELWTSWEELRNFSG